MSVLGYIIQILIKDTLQGANKKFKILKYLTISINYSTLWEQLTINYNVK